ncbi:5-oxoprolinase subunit PxpB [Alteromonadaceae bacterium BrNp21-10]|nr:5-oxoprolinase subunit PxpB [Alteromonadaceae bacterium BrNp21-10]
MRISVAGESTLMVHFEQRQSADVLAQVCALQTQVKQQLAEVIIDTTASYASLLICFDVYKISHQQLRKRIQQLLLPQPGQYPQLPETAANEIELPVYYGEEVALDLAIIAEHAKLTQQQVIELHQQQTYVVYAIGFAPGFAYLGTVDERIAIPRMATPRVKVPKGAVAIADQQTAVYPAESPGGWHIIGRCPQLLFDVNSEPAMPFAVGDKVGFRAVDYEEYIALGGILNGVGDGTF